MQITFELDESAAKIVKLAIDGKDQTPSTFASVEFHKMIEQKKVQFARQRLNLGKALRHKNVIRGVKGFESLEQSYLAEGMSADIVTFGGIMKVYTEIFAKSGFMIPQEKIRLAVVAVNQPQKAS